MAAVTGDWRGDKPPHLRGAPTEHFASPAMADAIRHLLPSSDGSEGIRPVRSVKAWNETLERDVVQILNIKIQRLDSLERSMLIKKGLSTLILIAVVSSFLYFMAAPFFTSLSKQLGYALFFGPILPVLFMNYWNNQVEKWSREQQQLVAAVYTLRALCEGEKRHSQVAGHLPGFDKRVACHYPIQEKLERETHLSTKALPEFAGVAGKVMATAIATGMSRTKMESDWWQLCGDLRAAKAGPREAFPEAIKNIRQRAYHIGNPIAHFKRVTPMEAFPPTIYAEWIAEECHAIERLKLKIEERMGQVDAVKWGQLISALQQTELSNIEEALYVLQKYHAELTDQLQRLKVPATPEMRKKIIEERLEFCCRVFTSEEMADLKREFLTHADEVGVIAKINAKFIEAENRHHLIQAKRNIHIVQGNPGLKANERKIEAYIHGRLKQVGIKCHQWEYRRGTVAIFVVSIALMIFSIIYYNNDTAAKWLRVAPLALFIPHYLLSSKVSEWKEEILSLRMAEKLLYEPEELERLPAYPSLQSYREKIALAESGAAIRQKKAARLGIDLPKSTFSLKELLHMGKILTQQQP